MAVIGTLQAPHPVTFVVVFLVMYRIITPKRRREIERREAEREAYIARQVEAAEKARAIPAYVNEAKRLAEREAFVKNFIANI